MPAANAQMRHSTDSDSAAQPSRSAQLPANADGLRTGSVEELGVKTCAITYEVRIARFNQDAHDLFG